MGSEADTDRNKSICKLLQDIKRGDVSASEKPLDMRGVSLSGEDLSGMDLSGVDFSKADLTRANLSGARLFKTKFSNASLVHANLTGSELAGSDLTDANMEGVEACRVGFGMANLKGARLFQANLESSTLTKATLVGADFRCVNLKNGRMREADVSNADFTGADLQNADLALCDLKGAIFNNADLRGSRLRAIEGFAKASWVGVDIRNINFAGAYRMRRFIVDQNYLKEFRESSRWASVVCYLWWLTSDYGRSLGRWCFWIALQALLFAFIYAAVGLDYGNYQTWLSPLYFSVVTLTTLGFGDAIPNSALGQFVSMAEVVTGYIMLGGLLSILSVKMSRRAD